MNILFVGQNPKSFRNILSPFTGTKSEACLTGWIVKLGVGEHDIINASNKLGSAINLGDIRSDLDQVCAGYSKIIALGTYAERALKRHKISYFAMPHPSGLNRKLNDKAYVEDMLKRCKEYLSE